LKALFVSSRGAVLRSPRVLVVAGDNSTVSLTQSYCTLDGRGASGGFSNGLTRVVVGALNVPSRPVSLKSR
jgi:hypothetical protein